MKRILLALNHGYLFFGTTLYVGVLWALHFFWFPHWETLRVENYYDQFIPPTSTATRFFTVVVPLMFLSGLIMIWSEWKSRLRWVPVGAVLCLATATFVGTRRIIPVNKILATHISDQDQLSTLLKRWMALNDVRWVLLTLMWLLLMFYFFRKGSTLDAIAGREA